jgi:hypothetical protein
MIRGRAQAIFDSMWITKDSMWITKLNLIVGRADKGLHCAKSIGRDEKGPTK